jgi:hypothetical protein
MSGLSRANKLKIDEKLLKKLFSNIIQALYKAETESDLNNIVKQLIK